MPKRRRFPTLPRRPGQRGNAEVDVPKIKEQYLSGADYAWADFGKSYDYPAESKTNAWFKEQVDWPAWKREWVRRRNIVAEEAITPEMIEAQRFIAENRLRYVKDYSSIAKNMKAILSHLMREHVMNAAHDQRNEGAIISGMTKKKLTVDAEELSRLASAGNRIAELEARALLIVAGDRNIAARTMDELGEDEVEKAKEDIPTYTFQPIGTSMTAQERTQMLAEYYDQFQQPTPAPALPSLSDAADQS